MDFAFDWVEPLLRCDVASGPRLLVILLGAVASSVTIAFGVRRLLGPSGPLRRAAHSLREEGERRSLRGEPMRAMELYNLSVLANPGPAHVYYLRGLIHEQRGQLNRAVADWKRCIARLPRHGDALAKLARYDRRSAAARPQRWRLAIGALVLIVALACAAFLLAWNDWAITADLVTSKFAAVLRGEPELWWTSTQNS